MIEKNRLLRAVLNRNITDIKDCLLDGDDLSFRDGHGSTYLHLSVYLRSEELVRFFLDEGLLIDTQDNRYLSALHRACRTGCERMVGLLLDYEANKNSSADGSITPLHIAAAFGHYQCVKTLIKRGKIGLEIDCRDDNGHTPLHYAASEGHIRVTEILLDNFSDANAENDAGNRPLHFAAVTDSSELCQQLVRFKADLDAQNINGQTALHLATLQACSNTVFYLLNVEADPNIRDNYGNTCSHLAIKNGEIDILKTLMSDSRTDTSICDRDENTVLHVALKLGHYNLIPIMLPRARDLTKQDSNGCSVIIEAIKNQLEDLALEMLEACPSLVHTATHDLVTPLHLAAERGMTNLTKQLLIAGAQVDAADASGLTPSLYCAKNDSVLECLAMIEDIMMVTESNVDKQQHVKGNKISSRISS